MAKKLSFEDHMTRLRSSVDELEAGDSSLDQSLKSFESAVASYRACRKYLDEFERKIELLVEDADGELKLKPFGDAGK